MVVVSKQGNTSSRSTSSGRRSNEFVASNNSFGDVGELFSIYCRTNLVFPNNWSIADTCVYANMARVARDN